MEWREIVYKLFKNKISLVGLAIIIIMALVAIFAPWIAPPRNPAEPILYTPGRLEERAAAAQQGQHFWYY